MTLLLIVFGMILASSTEHRTERKWLQVTLRRRQTGRDGTHPYSHPAHHDDDDTDDPDNDGDDDDDDDDDEKEGGDAMITMLMRKRRKKITHQCYL